ncbi:uncharacterized protein LOC135494865 [Lineus longissimus]|uniref:uncharacterized protein LOC135494865 n=1 Tax=Lineus longissimus TaxID=88925 RepID=UPI00315DD28A
MVLRRFLVIGIAMLGALLRSAESRGNQSAANDCEANPDKELIWIYEKGPAVRHAVAQSLQTNVKSQYACQKLCIKKGRMCSLYEYYGASRTCRLCRNRIQALSGTQAVSSEFVRGEWKCIHHPSREFCRLVESKPNQNRSTPILVIQSEKVVPSSLAQCKVRCASKACKAMIFKDNSCYLADPQMSNLKCGGEGCSLLVNHCYRTNWIEEEITHRVSFDGQPSGEISDRNITGSLMTTTGRKTSGPTQGVVGAGFHLAKSDHIQLVDNTNSSCFGTLASCTEGLTLSLWYRTKSSGAHNRDPRRGESVCLFRSSYLSVKVFNYRYRHTPTRYSISYGKASLNASSVMRCLSSNRHLRQTNNHTQKNTWGFLALRINTKTRSHHVVRLSRNGRDLKLFCRSYPKASLIKYGIFSPFESKGMASIGNKPSTNHQRKKIRRFRWKPTPIAVDVDEYQFWSKHLPDSSISKLYTLRKVKA